MKVDANWGISAILTLPVAWFFAFLLYMRPLLFSDVLFLLFSIGGFLAGLFFGAILTDKVSTPIYLLIVFDTLLLIIGISQFLLPIEFWTSILGFVVLFLMVLLFGSSLVFLTVFLNQLVSSVRRGHVAGVVSVLALLIGATLSVTWRIFSLPSTPPIAPSITAALILFIFIVSFFVRPWKKNLRTYIVPGSVLPYVLWWLIYLMAFGLYIWATPSEYRFILNSFILFGPGQYHAELVLFAIGGSTLIFAFLPDRLGRKRVFSVATVLLAELCIFGATPLLGGILSFLLLIFEVFIIGFIIGVGVWLVWAEIGSVRFKGHRSAFAWGIIGITLGLLWFILLIPPLSLAEAISLAVVIYPIAATLVLFSIFPLTNAKEVLWNERIVEDIDIHVDTSQVSRALRDLEVDTSLKSIEKQLESELEQLIKIKGISRNRAIELRNVGYETPELIANANPVEISELLSISPEVALQIIESAKRVKAKRSNLEKKTKTRQHKGSKSSREGQTRKKGQSK